MRWLLRRVVGHELAENILGDLEEEATARFPTHVLRRRLWLARGLWAVTMTVIVDRGRAAARRPLLRPTAFVHDVRHAMRALAAARWYAVTVTSVLTLAIALATTVFAVVDGVLMKPLPYPRVEEVVALRPGWKARPDAGLRLNASASEAVAWMDSAPDVTFAMWENQGLDGEQIGGGAPVPSAAVSSRFLELLGQLPLRGGFRPEHFTEARTIRPALMTYGAWERRFGLDPGVIGRVFHGDQGKAIEIVGVLSPDFLFPSDKGRWVPELLTPLVLGPGAAMDRSRGLDVIARIPSSMSVTALESRLEAASRRLAGQFPRRPGQSGPGPIDIVRVVPIDEALRSDTRVTFALVLSLAIVLVLIACLNVTGLAAARAQDRRRELSVRRALGAGSRDVLRLLAVESAFVVGISTAMGLALSWYLLRGIGAWFPEDLVLLKALAIDVRVGVFVIGMSVLVVVLTTLWPARVALRAERSPGLLNGGRSTSRQHAASRFVLIGGQVALGFVMTIAGALLAGELVRVWRQDAGYRTNQTLNVWLTDRAQPTRADTDAVLADVRRIPGVKAAGGFNIWLLQRAMLGSRGFEKPLDALGDGAEGVGVTTGFFEAAGLAPVAGRWPTDAELSQGARVVAVSERVAREYWPDRWAIGQVVQRRGEPYTVVGVVPDARYLSLEADPFGVVYYPIVVDRGSLWSVFISYDKRVPPDASAIVSLIDNRHSTYRVRSIQSVTSSLANSIRLRTFQTALFVTFAAAGVIIVSVGVLGLVAILTGRRTREMGLRLALGAKPTGIVGLVLRQELAAVAVGLAGGAVLAGWLMRFVESYMYKASVYDPIAWSGAFALLLVAATAGVLIPAFRASRTNPIDALRVE